MISIGLNNTATAVDAVYIGIKNVAKQVVAAYIGVDGKAMAIAIAARLAFVTIQNDFNTRHQQIMVTCDGNIYTSSFFALTGKPFTVEVVALQQMDAGTPNVASGRIKDGLTITATAPKPHYDTYLEFEMRMEAVPTTVTDNLGYSESGTLYRPTIVHPLNDLTPTFDLSALKFELTDIDSYGARGGLVLPKVYASNNIPSYFAMDILIDDVSAHSVLWSSNYEDFPESYIVGIKNYSSINYTTSTRVIDISSDGTLTADDWFSSMGILREGIISLLQQKINTNPYFKVGFGIYEIPNGVEIDLKFNDVCTTTLTQGNKKFKSNNYKAVVRNNEPFTVKTETVKPFYQGLYTTVPNESRYFVTSSYEPLIPHNSKVDFIMPFTWYPSFLATSNQDPQIAVIQNKNVCITRHLYEGLIFSEDLELPFSINANNTLYMRHTYNAAGATENKAIFFNSGQIEKNILESITTDGTCTTSQPVLWCDEHSAFYAVNFDGNVLRIGGYFYDCESNGRQIGAPVYKVDDNLTISHLENLYVGSYIPDDHAVVFGSHLLRVLNTPDDGSTYTVFSTDFTATLLDCTTSWPSTYRIPWRNGCVFDCGYDAAAGVPKMKYVDANLTLMDLPHYRYIYGEQNSTSDYHIETTNGTFTITDGGFAFLDSTGVRRVLTHEINYYDDAFPLVEDLTDTIVTAKPLPYSTFMQFNKYAVLRGEKNEGGQVRDDILLAFDLTYLDNLINWMQTNIV